MSCSYKICSWTTDGISGLIKLKSRPPENLSLDCKNENIEKICETSSSIRYRSKDHCVFEIFEDSVQFFSFHQMIASNINFLEKLLKENKLL